MSRAFVSEEAEESRASRLPERPISPHPNLVTPNGLVLIDEAVAGLQAALGEAGADVGREGEAVDEDEDGEGEVEL